MGEDTMEKQASFASDNGDEIAVGLWDQLNSLLKNELSSQCLKTWFSNIHPSRYSDEDGLQLDVPNDFIRVWIIKHYLSLMEELLSNITSTEGKIIVAVNKELEGEQLPGPAEAAAVLSEPKEDRPSGASVSRQTSPRLLPHFSFDNFIVADCNRMAYNACRSVAESPIGTYNPLIIFGGTGLGKTHMLRAIENHLLAHRSDLRTIFVSSEKFMNEYIYHTFKKTVAAFRDRFRSADVLLIDDIQEWNQMKKNTQGEFLNTFNELYQGERQIVISSNVHPQFSDLSGPIKSRFDGGLVLEVRSPTVETCAAILSQKAEEARLKLQPEVVYWVANRYHSSIRQLEGALKKLVFYQDTYHPDEITIDVASNALADLPVDADDRITMSKIIHNVSAHFDVRFNDLISASRKKSVAYPRHLAMYLCRRLTDHSLPEIGQQFGGRDHTTVLHAINKIEKEMELADSTASRESQIIEEKIKSAKLPKATAKATF